MGADGNHYHLLVETPRANLVSGMQLLPGDEGEPKGRMLYENWERCLTICNLNPVRSGIVGGRSGKSLLDYPWSSLIGAYLCGPRKRPQWAHVEMAFSLFGLKDSAAGRRQFLERLELRARGEPARSCGARLPEGHSLQSTLRRGWYIGSQAFRERLLALLPQSDARVRLQGQHYEAAALMREAAEQKAEKIFIRELRTAGLTEEELGKRPRSDPVKWKIARAIRTESTVSLKWIARRLDLGSASNVSHKINFSRFKS